MIIDCISDLHGEYPELEGGDLLIIAGDLTARDTLEEHFDFMNWVKSQNYKKFIVIAGNHENVHFKAFHESKRCGERGIYLCDSGIEFEGLKIWGSPWTKTFEGMNPHCKAFTCDTEEELAEKFSKIPDDIDILITHSPPYQIFDRTSRSKEYVGSKYLRNLVISNRLPNLKLHVFGHIHEHGGKKLNLPLTTFVNASIMNEDYEHVNKPVRVIL